jgi:hypothetical protein
MPMMYAADRSAWDFLNPSNWVINKSLEQNIKEFSVGSQIMGTVIPEALAYKAAQQITGQLATQAATRAAIATSTTASTATGAATGATAAIGGAGAIAALGLAETGIMAGAGIYGLEWLKKNWWIAGILIAGLIAYKVVEK